MSLISEVFGNEFANMYQASVARTAQEEQEMIQHAQEEERLIAEEERLIAEERLIVEEIAIELSCLEDMRLEDEQDLANNIR